MTKIGKMSPVWAFLIGAFWINTTLVIAAGVDTLRAELSNTDSITVFAAFTLVTLSVQAVLILYAYLMPKSAAVGLHNIRDWIARNQQAALAAQARLINDRNLDMRLPVPDTADEISDLSKTLNQMLERIDKAFASIRAFTGNASHELRTPISLLRAEIDVALFRPRNAEEYHVTLLRLNEEAVRMTNLVENLLSLARADGGAEAMSLAPVDARTLLYNIDRIWAPAMQRAMLDFRIETDDGLALLGDANGLQRLFSILLENAAKFTPPGGSVTLSVTRSGSRVVFSVRDTGIGIAAEDMPRIFDRFYRGAQTSNAAPRGSGLGLALAKWIAERHGTQLSVESQPGQGSCFSISLECCNLPHSITAASVVAIAG